MQKIKLGSLLSSFSVVSAYLIVTLVILGSSSSSGYVDGAQEFPIINKCCPDDTEYSVESDECVRTKVEVRIDANRANNQSHNSTNPLIREAYAHSFSVQEYLSLPKKFIHPLTDGWNFSEISDFKFRLEQFLPNNTATCANGSFIVQIKITGNGGNETEEDSKPEKSALLTDTGKLKYSQEYFTKSEFCISGFDGETISIRVCNATCRGETPCVRKCCDLNEVWNQVRGTGRNICSPAGKHMWTPFFYKSAKTKATEAEMNAVQPHYHIAHPREWCNRSYNPAIFRPSGAANKFRILLTGDLVRSVSRYDWKDTPEDPQYFCVDGVMNPTNLPPEIPTETEYSGMNEVDSMVFDCAPEPPQSKSRSQSILYGVVLIFSSIFLLLTIAVYILLWEKQNVHGWTLMCYAISLFFMYIFFVMMHFSQFSLIQGNNGKLGSFCYFIGVGLNFFFVSTFCWMSMINFDLWCTFKALKPTGGRSKGFKRFLGYTAFAVGVPTAIVSVALALDSNYADDYDSEIIVPEYGRKRCNLDPKYAQLAYAYGPAGVLLGCNLIFFTVTMFQLYHIHQSTKFATSSSSKSEKQKQSVQLFAKLLFVMGIPWIFEVISWAAERETSSTSWYWVIFDMINILQALAIFLIFVCKRDIIHSLEQKYPRFKAFLNRVLLDSEKADRISKQYPRLKGILKPITRRSKDAHSSSRHTETSYTASQTDIHDKEDINMQTSK